MPIWWDLRKLGSPDPRKRRRAIEKLQGRPAEPEAVRAVERAAMSDLDPGVREAAIRALGAMGDLASVPSLLRIHAESERLGARELAIAAKAALLEMGEPVLPILSREAAGSDLQVRRSATEIGRKMRQRERRADRPAGAGKDPDRIADRLAGDLAPRLADRADRSRNQQLRSHRCAVEDLQQLRELPPASLQRHVPLLEKALSCDSDVIRREAMETLFHALGAEATPRLLASLGSSSHGAMAARMLSSLGEAAPVRELVDLLREPHEEAAPRRTHAARALGLLRREELLPVLLSALSDPDPGVRAEVCTGLGGIAGPRAIAELIHRLRDQDLSVREQAIVSLGQLPADEARPAVEAELIRCLQDEAGSVREAAVKVLGELSVAEAVPALERCLHEDPYTVKREWETWFGARLEDYGVADVYPVREAAEAALHKIRRSPNVALRSHQAPSSSPPGLP